VLSARASPPSALLEFATKVARLEGATLLEFALALKRYFDFLLGVRGAVARCGRTLRANLS
jgi:hypothetical protein